MTHTDTLTAAQLFAFAPVDRRPWDTRAADPCVGALEPVTAFVRHMLEHDADEYEAIRNLDDALEFDVQQERFNDAVASWVNSADGRGVEDYDVVTEFCSSWELPAPTPTRVVFRSFSPGADWQSPDGVIVLMPDEPFTRHDDGMCLSYMHHGQHDGASRSLVDTLYRVGRSTYTAGLDELVRQGYLPVVDTSPGGVTVAPSGLPHNLVVGATFGSTTIIRRNDDARELCDARAEFANRSYTLRGRHVYVPPGTTVEYRPAVDDEGTGHGVVLSRRPDVDGVAADTEFVSFGLLPLDYARALVAAIRRAADSADPFVYLVQSYSTPLLVHTLDDVLVPRVQYSMTTTRHARAVFGAGYTTPARRHTDPLPARA